MSLYWLATMFPLHESVEIGEHIFGAEENVSLIDGLK